MTWEVEKVAGRTDSEGFVYGTSWTTKNWSPKSEGGLVSKSWVRRRKWKVIDRARTSEMAPATASADGKQLGQQGELPVVGASPPQITWAAQELTSELLDATGQSSGHQVRKPVTSIPARCTVIESVGYFWVVV